MTLALERADTSSKNDKAAEIRSLYRECWDFAFRNWSPYQSEATDDLAYFLGSQWNPQDRAFLQSQRRNALVFNKIRRIIKMVTGFERKSRHSLIAQPVENADEFTADQLSAVLLWVANHANLHHTMSDAFEGALKTGMNLVSLALDFTDDPIHGDLKYFRIPYNAFLLDPRFTRRDLQDCEFILQRRQMSRDAVKALLPFKSEQIDDLPAGNMDDRFPFMQRFSDTFQKEVLRYDEFWLRKFKDVKVLIDQETGEMIQLPLDRDWETIVHVTGG